jgi:hypothetical protein
MRLSRLPAFKMTCLLNVLCGEFYFNINVILTSKIKHFIEHQVVYPSYSAYHTVRNMNICINKERSRHQASKAIRTSLGQRVIAPKQFKF